MINKQQFEMQANAVLGFSVWLTSTLPRQTDGSREFSAHLLHVLRVYEWESNRQIDGDLATQGWFSLVAITQILAQLLLDEHLEAANASLKDYLPTDEPQTIGEMVARLLFDALVLFEQSQNEMATYLEKPVVPAVLQGFMQRVLSVQATT